MDIRLAGTYTAPESGVFYATLSGLGPSRLLIDGKVVFEQADNCADSMGFILGGVVVPRLDIPLQAGRQYAIEVVSQPPTPVAGVDLGILEGKVGVRLGWVSAATHDVDHLPAALAAARAADIAIVFTGHEPAWETEGQDQAGFHLPAGGSQDRLVAGVAGVNRNTVVVNATGVAVAMPWLDDIQALLQTWFPGQEAGRAIADVLTGKQNPEGHLTCTFPKRIEDCPAYGNFPGTFDGEGPGRQLSVEYKEGVFVGYRHFDRLPADAVNFPFGFGLSYTTFGFSELSVRRGRGDSGSDGEEYVVSVRVSNTGGARGAVAVQLYVGAAAPQPEDPVKALVGFAKVALDAGESKIAEVPVRARDFAFWSEAEARWFVRGGEYVFSVGRSAAEMVASERVVVEGRTWAP